MASDFYTFKGTVGSHEVIVDFCDTDQPDADSACVRSVDGEANAHDFYTLAALEHRDARASNAEYDRCRQTEREITELIRKGQFNLEYQGGWSPDGSSWGRDNAGH
ncbi:MAG: hypothetical protein A3D44_01640 [Candidatus Staskawiczbacteria bacterium RIFCSPHIGHO2_02_FULL_42_22]|uniref:Uncharacterized protein n=1 Tax=Candidatus Staskawiczbacteria bacterium RIFCSPHIGHO2_02_FULL_42_22 TaxID=1802207 RepID=A0A1G2I1N7_9BACT|nr:MAG: hypothetical protein A3D44_01640 [Candidatus Staskawiczbacteria bacterium RIFCSPHIGHO2_02_FULL_42_22]